MISSEGFQKGELLHLGQVEGFLEKLLCSQRSWMSWDVRNVSFSAEETLKAPYSNPTVNMWLALWSALVSVPEHQ